MGYGVWEGEATMDVVNPTVKRRKADAGALPHPVAMRSTVTMPERYQELMRMLEEDGE
jgi:hypothetical protein